MVRWCRLTSWRDKRGVPWLQTPYYDREGKLVGVQNRNLVKGGLPRFRFPQGAECGIYNLPVLNLLRPGEQLFIAEGCSDCWSLLSAGHKAIAIPSATLLSPWRSSPLSTLHSQRNFTCTPTVTRLANGSSCNCKRCCPRSCITSCPRAARTSVNCTHQSSCHASDRRFPQAA